MDYRLLALDIDGTLLNSSKMLTDRTRKAVERAKEYGFIVSLVSGRRPRSMLSVAKELGLVDPMVAYHGGVIADPVSLRSLHSVTVPRPVSERVMAAWERAEITTYAYCDSPAPPDVYYQLATRGRPTDSMEREGDNVWQVESLIRDTCFEPLRLAVGGDAAVTQLAIEIAQPLVDPCEIRLLRSMDYDGKWHMELLPAAATKASGLRWLCQHYGITPEQIIAVGDHLNDLDMIECAGLGVAMGNAQPEVKAVADLVIGHHDQDGLAVFIEELVARR